MNRWAVERAARQLRRGGVVAYPTEAVFGLGCDPASSAAVHRLLALKRRPAAKGLILIAADLAQLRPWLGRIDASERARLEATWPGPVTWLVPAAAGVPRYLRGGHRTLAVRVTAHPVAAALCRAAGGPIVSTSANKSGGQPLRTATEVRRRLGRGLDAVVPGEVGGRNRPTEIRDLASNRVVRPG